MAKYKMTAAHKKALKRGRAKKSRKKKR